MKNKKNMRRFLSGFLAMLTVLSTILSPILSYAADVVPEEPPLYEKVKNELDADEVVKAKNLDIKVVIGGAVITESFAEEIHADGYSEDAAECVQVVKRLLDIE